jgi:acyl carrier protein
MTPTQSPWSEETLQDWLVAKLAEELGIDSSDIDVQQPFAQYGVDSVLAVTLVADLEDAMGRELNPTLLFDYPCVEAIAQHLAGRTA